MSALLVWQKSLELSEKLKISADSAFSFWAVELEQKHGIGAISRKANFMRIILDYAFSKAF